MGPYVGIDVILNDMEKIIVFDSVDEDLEKRKKKKVLIYILVIFLFSFIEFMELYIFFM